MTAHDRFDLDFAASHVKGLFERLELCAGAGADDATRLPALSTAVQLHYLGSVLARMDEIKAAAAHLESRRAWIVELMDEMKIGKAA